MKFLIGIVALLILILAGCSAQITIKYQCVDGSFVDSVNLCSSKTCPEANCPKLDCASCPVKTETKVECLNGELKDKKEDCTNIQEIIKLIQKENSVDICSDPANKYLEKIEIKLPKSSFNPSVKWYPSLNEGWVESYNLVIKNAGCTIIDGKKISFKVTVYDSTKLIFSERNHYSGFRLRKTGDGLYPADVEVLVIPITDSLMFDKEYLKFNQVGNYPVKLEVYYDSKLIAYVEDVLVLQ